MMNEALTDQIRELLIVRGPATAERVAEAIPELREHGGIGLGLGRRRRGGRECRAQLGELVVQVGERAGGVRMVEAGRSVILELTLKDGAEGRAAAGITVADAAAAGPEADARTTPRSRSAARSSGDRPRSASPPPSPRPAARRQRRTPWKNCSPTGRCRGGSRVPAALANSAGHGIARQAGDRGGADRGR